MLQTGLTLTLDGRTMADMIADGPEDDRHLRTIAAHTSAYITHVRRQLKHTLPKAIVHCLVSACRPAALEAQRGVALGVQSRTYSNSTMRNCSNAICTTPVSAVLGLDDIAADTHTGGISL